MTEPPQPDGKASLPNRGAALRRVVLVSVGACVLVFGARYYVVESARDRVMPGVRVAELDVSGLASDQVPLRVAGWAEERARRALSFSLHESVLRFEPKSLGLQVDAQATTDRALAVGRAGSAPHRLLGFIIRWFRPEVVEPVMHFDPLLLGQVLDDWQKNAVKSPPFAGGVAVAGTSVSPLYAHAGTLLDRKRTEAVLRSGIARGRGGVALPTRVETPSTSREEVDRMATLARVMLTDAVELSSADGSHHLRLAVPQIASLIQVRPATEPGKLELFCAVDATQEVLKPERAALEQQPENARFVIDAQDHVSVEPGRGALLLDAVQVAEGACKAALSAAKKGELVLGPGAEPALSTDAAQRLGVVGLVGAFTTHHACCQPRVDNIHHIADLLDGTLVRPGETFSVNQLVGPRSVKNGFRLAPSIEDGDMVETVGGGVSQFATTLFNALFYGGYDILERQPHTYWFTRYPMGYDATLSYPHPDIIFKNDTDAGALIKTSYTGTTITVKIYGDNGGRKVRAEVSPRQNIVPPPVELIPNPHLDADEEKTREGGEIGWSVVVKRVLTFADGKTREERRKVTYKPRARRVEVHPCRIPAGEPGHTGERCPVPAKEDDSSP